MNEMKYTEFKTKCSQRASQIFNENGVFWAFSQKQFEEGKTPLNEGDSYIAIGGGGYMPKSNWKQLDESFDNLGNWEKELFQQVSASEAILYELENHEYCITGRIRDTLDVLSPLGVTAEQVKAVARANY